jgi:hypothetical protein
MSEPRDEALIKAIRAFVEEAVGREREEYAKIAEDRARSCGGSRIDGDKSKWQKHESHSDAHDACHESLDIAEAIRMKDLRLEENEILAEEEIICSWCGESNCYPTKS